MEANENYLPESYLTIEMVKEVMAEFTWPINYETMEDDELFNTIILKFPTCEIELYDVPEDGITINFSTYNNGKELDASDSDIVFLNCIENYDPENDFEVVYNDSNNKFDETLNNLRNAIKWLQQYHMGFITGEDYSWVERYIARKQ